MLTRLIASVKLEAMNTERTSVLEERVRRHAALADVTRLLVVDRLSVSDASASELGALLDVPSNLLAHHLRVLEQAGLVTRHRSEGDRRRSYLSLARGDLTAPDPLVTARRVVFVCTANTARSHLAAALWRRASTVDATSAGTHPADRVAPGAVAVARRHDLDLPLVAPRGLAEVLEEDDLVITVCDRAHEELGAPGWAHWSIPDPVPSGTRRAFDTAYRALAARVDALAPRLAPAS
jgi:protein-tyrosine-phosphatase